jgi:hypothetical protein
MYRSPARILTNDQLPASVFATEARDDRSAKYRFVPTITVLDELRANGFHPVSVSESRTLDDQNRAYVKHHIRLRRSEDLAIRLDNTDVVIPELALTNSHDGTSGFILDRALHRLVCSNGLVASTSEGTLRFRHTGGRNLVDDVIEGAYSIVEDFPRIADRVQEFRAINLTQEQRIAFATASLPLRFEQDPVTGAFPVTAQQLLTPKRYGDT